MASDKSISSGLSFSKWVKNKFGDSDLDDILLASIDHSGFFCYKYPESDPQMDTKTDLDSTQQSAMKRSATAPDSHFKTAAAEESSGSLYSVAHNLFSGKLFGNYLSAEKSKEETYKNRERRNSKSLPGSPLNSPRIYRKNPYFTDPFIRPDERFDGKSFFYLSISSPRRSLETLIEPAGTTNDTKPANTEPKGRPELYPKPSELRELNCWSPISM